MALIGSRVAWPSTAGERLSRAVGLKHFQRRKAQFLRWLRDFWSTAAFCPVQVIWNVAFRYILFNKPYGVLSQFSGEGETLRQFIPVKNVYPVGRLDHDSEGLLLLTDNGALQHRLSDPKFAHPRTYWAQVERIPDKGTLLQLERGIVIQEYRTRPAQVRLLEHEPPLPPRDPPIRFRKNVPTAWVEITLTEGRNRQVRRMTAAVGHPTLRLVRAAIGDLTLGSMLPGEWRELTAGELKLCFQL